MSHRYCRSCRRTTEHREAGENRAWGTEASEWLPLLVAGRSIQVLQRDFICMDCELRGDVACVTRTYRLTTGSAGELPDDVFDELYRTLKPDNLPAPEPVSPECQLGDGAASESA